MAYSMKKAILIGSYAGEKDETLMIYVEKKSSKLMLEHILGEKRKCVRIDIGNIRALIKILDIVVFDGEEALILMNKISEAPEVILLSLAQVLEKNSVILVKKQYRGKVTEYLTLATQRLDPTQVSASSEGTKYFQMISLGVVKEEDPATPAIYVDIRNWSKRRNAMSDDTERPTKVGIRLSQKVLEAVKRDVEGILHAVSDAGLAEFEDVEEEEEKPPCKKRKYVEDVEVQTEEPPLCQEFDDEHSLKTKNDIEESLVNQTKYETSPKEQVLDALVKVFHTVLVMKSGQLCDACYENQEEFLQVIREDNSIKKLIGDLIKRNSSDTAPHRVDCIVADAFKFITFHAAFVANVIAWQEGFDRYLRNMEEMLGSTTTLGSQVRKEVGKVFAQIQLATSTDHPISKELLTFRELLMKVIVLVLGKHLQ